MDSVARIAEFLKQYFPTKTLRWIEHVICAVAVYYVFSSLRKYGIKDTLFAYILKKSQQLPGTRGIIKGEQKKAISKVVEMVKKTKENDENRFLTIPASGVDSDKIKGYLEEEIANQKSFKSGKAMAGIYGAKIPIATEAYCMFERTNATYPLVFPGVRKFENDIIRMTINMLGGDDDCVGVCTTGGTESILMTVKAYRDYAKEVKGITKPNMVGPVTIHPAFKKACEYLCVEFITTPLTADVTVDIPAYKSRINKNTIMCAASAPCWPHGHIDDIPTLAGISKAAGVPFHVDSCLGGFLIPWLSKMGVITKKYNLKVPGVTSITADVHKYAHVAKGVSTVIFKDAEIRKYHFYTTTFWCGGLYASPSMTGSRSGGILASAWAAMISMGEDGFMKSARRCQDTFDEVVKGINDMDGVEIVGSPDACCLPFRTTAADSLMVADALEARGWKNFNRMQKPICMNLQLGDRTDFDVQAWLGDLKACIEEVKGNPGSSEGMASVYMTGFTLTADSGILKPVLRAYMNALYS